MPNLAPLDRLTHNPAKWRLPSPASRRGAMGGLWTRTLRRAALLCAFLANPATADTADVVTQHIRPGFAAFAVQAKALASVTSCDPAVLRPAFHATYDAWLAIAHLSLGPAEVEGRSLAILFWPDPKALGQKAQRALLTGDPAVLTPDAMAQQSVAARGLAGLERLLYPANTLPADPCPLIHATADDLARMADALHIDWGPFGDLLLSAGEPANPRFLTPDEATQALFTQLAAGLDYLADRRIGRPLGTFDKPRPTLAEARASGRSTRNVTLSLHALRDLARHLSPQSPRTEAAFGRAIRLASELDDPTFATLNDPQAWLKLEILQQAVRSTREAALTEIGPALGVTLGFNSQDGD